MTTEEYMQKFDELIIQNAASSPILKALTDLYNNGDLDENAIAYWVDQLITADESPSMIFNWCYKLNLSIVEIQNNRTNLLLNDYFFVLLYECITNVATYFDNLNKSITNPTVSALAQANQSEINLSNDILADINSLIETLSDNDIEVLEYLRNQSSHPTLSKYKIRLEPGKHGVMRIKRKTKGVASDELRKRIHERLKKDFNNNNLNAAKYYVNLVQVEYGTLMQKINLWHANGFFSIT
jgi:ribosomal protein L22